MLAATACVAACGEPASRQPAPAGSTTPAPSDAPAAAPAPTIDQAAAGDDPCPNADTQLALNACWAEAAAAAERAAADALTRATARLADRPAVAARIAATQSAWERYRDAQCDMAAAMWEGGSMAPMQVASCRSALARARQADLEALVADTAP